MVVLNHQECSIMENKTLQSYHIAVISLPKSHLRTLMGPNNYQEQNTLGTVHVLLTMVNGSSYPSKNNRIDISLSCQKSFHQNSFPYLLWARLTKGTGLKRELWKLVFGKLFVQKPSHASCCRPRKDKFEVSKIDFVQWKTMEPHFPLNSSRIFLAFEETQSIQNKGNKQRNRIWPRM